MKVIGKLSLNFHLVLTPYHLFLVRLSDWRLLSIGLYIMAYLCFRLANKKSSKADESVSNGHANENSTDGDTNGPR